MFLAAVTVDISTGDKKPPAMPRGYTIPTIDLSAQTHRQVIVDREEGQYLGHPTTVLLEDNKTMICVYPKGHGRGAIVMKRSTDAGKTWSERLKTPKTWATSKEVPTLHRVIDAKGVKRLIMFSGLYPCRMAVSEDDGKTWSELKPLGDWGGIVCMGDVMALKKPGCYMAMFHDDGRFFTKPPKRYKPRRMTVYTTFSTDGGLTWSFPTEIFHRSDVGLCEPGMIRSPDGKQIAALFRENYRVRNCHVIFSDDEGKTWTAPRELPASFTGDRHKLRYAPDGRLIATFRDKTLQSPTPGDWVMWVGRYEDIVKGLPGQYRVRLMDNKRGSDCAYPGLELLSDGTFVATTYGHWTAGQKPYIVSVRFKLAEIDALARKQAPN
ncbi:MAG: exo-alpha-sialidase [Phycisphaerae bacterium]|nr:exo-alpha-sialidase [Phycisphaerae bacterium]